jgi:monoamine oxidase
VVDLSRIALAPMDADVIVVGAGLAGLVAAGEGHHGSYPTSTGHRRPALLEGVTRRRSGCRPWPARPDSGPSAQSAFKRTVPKVDSWCTDELNARS